MQCRVTGLLTTIQLITSIRTVVLSVTSKSHINAVSIFFASKLYIATSWNIIIIYWVTNNNHFNYASKLKYQDINEIAGFTIVVLSRCCNDRACQDHEYKTFYRYHPEVCHAAQDPNRHNLDR